MQTNPRTRGETTCFAIVAEILRLSRSRRNAKISFAGSGNGLPRVPAVPFPPSAGTPSVRFFDDAQLADDDDAYLPRIHELVFDRHADFLREQPRFPVVDFFAGNDDADFVSRLDRERVNDAAETLRDGFEAAYALRVAFARARTRSRPRRGNGIREHHERTVNGRVADFAVVAFHGIDDFRRLSRLLENARSRERMRGFVFRVQRFSDVVEKPRARRQGNVQTELGRENAAELRRFDGMRQRVLVDGETELELAEQFADAFVHAEDAEAFAGFRSRLDGVPEDFFMRGFDEMLDALRVDAPVVNVTSASTSPVLLIVATSTGAVECVRGVLSYASFEGDSLSKVAVIPPAPGPEIAQVATSTVPVPSPPLV